MAERFGIHEFPAPSGGCCFLADRAFGRRLRDLIGHRAPGAIGPDDLRLLKLGRHFRLAHDLKLVLGRDEPESTWLRLAAGERWTCQVADGRGAFGVIEGEPGGGARDAMIAGLAARYSRHRGAGAARIALRRAGEERFVEAVPADDDTARRTRI
jgi:hypothetical protein